MWKRWFVVCVALSSAGAASAAPQVRQYSADMEVEAGGHRLNMKLYVDVGKTRTEMALPGMMPGSPSMQMVSVALIDEGKMFMLYPDSRMYEEKSLEELDLQLSAAAGDQGTLLGTETVDGQVCSKYEVASQGGVVYVWTTQDQGLPVKLMPADGSATVRFKNVRAGPQSDSLFEVPRGYTQGSPMKDMVEKLIPNGLVQEPSTASPSRAYPDFSSSLEEMRKQMNLP